MTTIYAPMQAMHPCRMGTPAHMEIPLANSPRDFTAECTPILLLARNYYSP